MTDESYIQLALEIAKKGMGDVSPNPLVGCVIVKKDRIVGAGFHEKFGGNHAEINAINTAKESLEDSVLYVNLEPCSHYGKTPPCVDKIIENKIKRVVIGTLDMNPSVSGNGVKKLIAAGIDVKVGVLENECVKLNKFFFKYITKKIPYVTLKAAQTLDGKIADKNGDSKWITSVQSRRYVHSLRSQYDAVLVGTGTVEKDDPNLTVRLIEGRNPKRIIIDTNLRLKTSYRVYNKDNNLIVLTSKNSAVKESKIDNIKSKGAQVVFVKEDGEGNLHTKSILKELGKIGIASVLVEGGNKIFTSFVEKRLFDDIFLFISPKLLGDGISIVGNIGVKNIKYSYNLKIEDTEKIGDDIVVELSK